IDTGSVDHGGSRSLPPAPASAVNQRLGCLPGAGGSGGPVAFAGGGVARAIREVRGVQRVGGEEMKAIRIATLSALIAGASIGLAGPASADPLDGPYNLVVINGHGSMNNGTTNSIFASACGPDCTRLNAASWSADLHLAGNTWTGVASN